jgi:hypothetical protein
MGMKRLGLVLLLCLAFNVVYAQDDLVTEAFTAIKAAEEAGADVSELVLSLNEALALIESGDSANGLLGDIIADADSARVTAVNQGNIAGGVAILKVVVLVGVAAFVWLRGDEYFWRLWRRTKEGYIVD